MVGALLRPDTQPPDQSAPHPLRRLAASSGVAAVALAAAAVLGLIHPSAPDGWQSDLITDGQGARYVVVAGRLHPVANLASAKLILGRDFKRADVSDKALATLKKSQGPAVGIIGAPETLPGTADLDLKDWSLCSAAGKTVVEVGYPASGGALMGSQAILVQDETRQQYVVSGGTKYKVFDRNVLVAFNVPMLKPRMVPSSWLAALPSGDPLGIPRVPGTFAAVARHPAPAGFNRVGMFGKTLAANGTAAYYVVSGAGLTPVSLTVYELYQREPRLAQYKETERILAQSAITEDMLAPPAPGLNWPTDPPQFPAAAQDPAKAAVCVSFGGAYDESGRAEFTLSVSAALPHPLEAGEAGAGPGDIASGHGAEVQDDSGQKPAKVYLITDSGARYQLVDDAAARLGYADVTPAKVPAAWLNLLVAGPPLDAAAAAGSSVP